MRVTKDMLERRVALLNDMTGATYHIDMAYGGFRLVRVVNSNGGTADASPRLSKRELYEWINAYIDGIEVGLRYANP